MMNCVEFKLLFRKTCAEWWDTWKMAANIEDVDKRNKYLDDRCHEYMDKAEFVHEAMLMADLTEVAKKTLEMYQYPVFGREGYEDDKRISGVSA